MPLLNPSTYLVILEAKTTGIDYSPFVTELQASENWWHFITTTWIVIRRDSLAELQTKLIPLIGVHDR